MKTPKWGEGTCGAITYGGNKLFPHDKVTLGMLVSAKCKEKFIRLRITHETGPDIFKAVVVGHYFLNKAEEINDGDEVTIDRKHILWLNG